MQQNFPLFQSHLDLAHGFWRRLLNSGDMAIDATCGNGNDTLVLAEILSEKGGGEVIGIDIQEGAIQATRELLQTQLSPAMLDKVHLFHQSHSDFPQMAKTAQVKLVVYNLGYLPRGNKELTTLTGTTLQSVQSALELILPGGAVSITCYPGHAEGAKEEMALHEMFSNLPSALWNVCIHSFPNRKKAPSLILIQRNQTLL